MDLNADSTKHTFHVEHNLTHQADKLFVVKNINGADTKYCASPVLIVYSGLALLIAVAKALMTFGVLIITRQNLDCIQAAHVSPFKMHTPLYGTTNFLINFHH